MEMNNDTFLFFDTEPLDRARDLLQECRPRDNQLKRRSIARKALDISEQSLEAWLLYIQSYSQFPQSVKNCLRALDIAKSLFPKPRNTTANYQPNERAMLDIYAALGSLYYQHEDYTAAIATLLEGLRHDDSDPASLRATLVLCYIYSNKFEEAETLCHHPAFEPTLSSKVAQAYIHFLTEFPEWTPDQMDELPDLLFGRTLWQWMHERCNSMKRHYRAINHANPFFAAFMLNPDCHSISLPTDQPARHAAEALAVAQQHQDLWRNEELPLQLLTDFPWSNPAKNEITPSDIPLLKKTIKLLEKHQESLRNSAERSHLDDHFY